ncbi:MAG: 16S rRNA (cytidine(1402)-2'-O)-methyltransferase [Bacteroidetes bacterium]|nr:16S rRNA (cytidine(1402)-2'-O)-methyltransferase [Bacteroidota bacterium]MBU2585595.1 16S rRNA (cytidine(1402)-2'-O)-methyltransferase [Bacteroidota bacterium]
MPGKLYIVSTPIGNLEDISPRAIETLQNSDLILCEDTRTSSVLLSHYQIKKPLESYHAHNEDARIDSIIKRLKEGKIISIISDSGTPGISDPGAKLIKACIDEGIDISPIPGSNALMTALVMSGFEIKSFYFEGFIPQKKGRQTKLREIASRKELTVFYESPFRIKKLINELVELCPNRKIALCRELTKKFEEVIRGKVIDIKKKVDSIKIKGEFTIIIKPLSIIFTTLLTLT